MQAPKMAIFPFMDPCSTYTLYISVIAVEDQTVSLFIGTCVDHHGNWVVTVGKILNISQLLNEEMACPVE